MDAHLLNLRDILTSSDGLQKIIDVVPSPVFVKDEQHRWLMLNEAMTDLLGHSQRDLLGKSDYDVFPPEQAAVFWAKDDEVFASGLTNESEEAFTDATGRLRIVLTRKCLVRVGPGIGKLLLVGVVSDITPYREAEARSLFLSRHDVLTGIANRSLFQDQLREAVDRARAGPDLLAVLLIDLDGFKDVNDRHGHEAGDELLRVVAGRMTRVVRVTDTVARLGGDEFGIILRGHGPTLPAQDIAASICAAVREPIPLAGTEVTISASVGVTLFSDAGTGPEDLMHQADVAMYSVKRGGRHGHRLYGPGLEAIAGSHLETDLRAAERTGQLRVVFDAQRQTRDGVVSGHEARLQWQHPQHGEIAPEVFLPIAQRVGLVPAFGRLLLRAGCMAARDWPATERVAVDVLVGQSTDCGLLEVVASILRETGLSPDRLELEINEIAMSADSEADIAILRALQSTGVRLALDDFGRQSASLTLLHRLPVDRIKISRRCVQRLDDDERAWTIVTGVVQLAHALGAKVTAEGVRSAAHVRRLAEINCDEVQGFAFGPG